MDIRRIILTDSDLLLSMRLFFFFFQAEDGIRDLTVTGVQTCALPIFLSAAAYAALNSAVAFSPKYSPLRSSLPMEVLRLSPRTRRVKAASPSPRRDRKSVV